MPAFSNKFIFSLLGGLTALMCLFLLVQSRNHYRDALAAETSAHQLDVANYRAAAAQATAADAKHKAAVEAQQSAVNERTSSDYEARIAAVRARYDSLLKNTAATHPGSSSPAPVSGVSTRPTGATPATAQDGLPADDALIATEQAIQLDTLIQWVNEQTKVNTDEHPSQ